MAKKETVIISNPDGLFASPAEQLVDFTKQFNSDVTLTYAGKTVNLKSLMGVVSLGVPKEADITITADGYDENKAVREIVEKMKEIQLI